MQQVALRPNIGLPVGFDRAVQVRAQNIMLSLSGAAFPADYDKGNKLPIIPPELFGYIEKLEVTGLSPSGTRNKNTFEIGADGKLKPGYAQPLGHVPYELALIGKDGERYTTIVDITPGKIKESSQGYYPLGTLTFERALHEQFTAGRFMLSQSGSAFPFKYGERDQEPFLPNNNGFFESVTVTSLSESRVRTSNTFKLSADGQIQPLASTHPLGHVPYEITLNGKDGSQYTAVVDVSPRKVGKSSQGYFHVEDTVFTRKRTEVDTRTASPLNQADTGFVSSGGGAPKSEFGNSPLGAFASRGAK
jgi:hypothetical protein